MNRRIISGTLGAALAVSAAWSSSARADDPELIRPRSCLIAPWDETDGFQSYNQITNKSSGNIVTHWVYWSSTCDKLADVTVCLTPDGSHIMDSSAVQNSIWVDGESQNRGDPIDLGTAAEARGLEPNGTLYVSAYEARAGDFLDCIATSQLAPEAIIGRWATADTVTNVSSGGNDEGFGLDISGSYCDLPERTLDAVTVQTFAPASLTTSSVVGYVAEERAGEDGGFPGELGPACRRRGAIDRPCVIEAETAFYNSNEIRTSLPDVIFACSIRFSLLSGITANFGTGGTYVFTQPLVIPTDLVLSPKTVGGTTWAGGFNFEGVGPYGAAHAAWIKESVPEPTPTPAEFDCPPERQIRAPITGEVIGCLPEPTPVPTPTPEPTAEPTPLSCPDGFTPILDPGTGEVIGCIPPSTPTPEP